MRYGSAIVTPPTAEPLLLPEVKAHIRIDHADEDAWLIGRIKAAREFVETATGRQLMTATWDVTFDRFPCRSRDELRLPFWPVQSVTSIKYIDPAGVEQTWSPSGYKVDTTREPAIVRPASGGWWPAIRDEPRAVTVRQISGYASAELVPETAKHVMYLLIGHWHVNREAVVTGTIASDLQLSVDSLLSLLSAGELP